MTGFVRRLAPAMTAAALVALVPQHAFAQGGPMIVEPVRPAFVITPEAKVTDFNRRAGLLAGGSAGWVLNDLVFVGGAGYALVNRTSDHELAYGGVVLGIQAPTDRRVGFGVRTLVGAGSATTSIDARRVPYDPRAVLQSGMMTVRFGTTRTPMPVQGSWGQTWAGGLPMRAAARGWVYVVEPEATLRLNFTERVRLHWGIGYRFAGCECGVGDELRGASSSLGLRVGFGS